MVNVFEDKELFRDHAKVIFDTREDSKERTEWLKLRHKSIGGSEIGKIMGVSKYGGPITVWQEKLGLVEPFKGNVHTKFGNRMEPLIRDWVQEDFKDATDIYLHTFEYPYMMLSNEHDFISANIDGVAYTEKDYEYSNEQFIKAKELIGIEIKTARESLEKLWIDDEVPGEYYCQCQWYMYVTGLKYFMIIYMIGKEIHWKVIPRCDTDIKVLVDTAIKFWNENILKEAMPEPIGIDADTKAILNMQAVQDEQDVEVADDKLEKYKDLDEKIKAMEQEKEKIKQQIFLDLGNSKKGSDGYYKISRWEVHKESIDTKLLKSKYADIYKAVLKGTTSYVNMRISKIS